MAHNMLNGLAIMYQEEMNMSLKKEVFPELDVGDNLTLNTLFTEDVEGTLLSNEITFDGTLKAKSKILKK